MRTEGGDRASASGTGLSPEVEPCGLDGFATSIPDAEWRGTKTQREALRAKFDGKCAYCGNDLDRMHADHLEPVVRVKANSWNGLAADYMVKPERNVVSNMMPACAACNLHKGGYSLEGWRDILQRSAAILRRDTSTFRAGERFGVISVSEQPIRFHFEKLAACPSCDGDFPMYGVAPHECYWRKGPEFTLGQSTLLPIEQWTELFVPDLNDDETWADFQYPSACGIHYCPTCCADQYAAAWAKLVARIGPPPAQVGTHPKGGDSLEAPALLSDAAAEGHAPNPNPHRHTTTPADTTS